MSEMQKDNFVVALLTILAGKGESATHQEINHHDLNIFTERQLKSLYQTEYFCFCICICFTHIYFYMVTALT